MKSELFYKSPKTILNKGTGFLSGYTHSLNPYTGCSFVCSYCYVREMPVSLFREGEWGNWVDVKNGAAISLTSLLPYPRFILRIRLFVSLSTRLDSVIFCKALLYVKSSSVLFLKYFIVESGSFT